MGSKTSKTSKRRITKDSIAKKGTAAELIGSLPTCGLRKHNDRSKETIKTLLRDWGNCSCSTTSSACSFVG